MEKNYTLKYLEYLKDFKKKGWINSLKDVLSNNSDDIENIIISKLVLLNPLFYDELILHSKSTHINKQEKIKKIQGRRIFKDINFGPIKCESKFFWGYECPFDDENKVIDHSFPYSLGGPTNNAFNRRVLCKWHNSVKSNDIHNYPWEKLFKDYLYLKKNQQKHWIDIQVEKMMKEFNIT